MLTQPLSSCGSCLSMMMSWHAKSAMLKLLANACALLVRYTAAPPSPHPCYPPLLRPSCLPPPHPCYPPLLRPACLPPPTPAILPAATAPATVPCPTLLPSLPAPPCPLPSLLPPTPASLPPAPPLLSSVAPPRYPPTLTILPFLCLCPLAPFYGRNPRATPHASQ